MVSLSACVGRTAVRYDSDPHYAHSDDRYYKQGPPPHAPAHGYRHKYHNHDLIYDSGLRAYIVVGFPDYYFDNGFYFRYREGDWEMSGRIDDDHGWKHADDRYVPSKLKSSKHKKSKYRDKDRSHDNNGKRDKKRDRDDYDH